jgi:hypothetical protein
MSLKPNKNTLIAKVRMYNQQDLGDCFLLKFSNSTSSSWILIDFGSYEGGNAVREKKIAENISKTIGLDEVRIVVTHQHKDHVSGFINAFENLKGLKVPELWLSYLDDPDSEIGDTVRDISKKYWDKNIKLNLLANKVLGSKQPVKTMLNAKKSYDLFAEQQISGKAYTNLKSLAKNKIRFLSPGDSFGLPGLEKEVKVYVLGPPADFESIKSMNPKKGEDVSGLRIVEELDISTDFLLNSLDAIDKGDVSAKRDFPFDESYYKKLNRTQKENVKKKKPEGLYNSHRWRQIEYEWINDIGTLSLAHG